MLDDEKLVGSLAMLLGLISLGFSLGPWDSPYRLRYAAALSERFGKTAARLFWLLLAVILAGLGAVIIAGVRPEYARPQSSTNLGTSIDGLIQRTLDTRTSQLASEHFLFDHRGCLT